MQKIRPGRTDQVIINLLFIILGAAKTIIIITEQQALNTLQAS